MTQYRYRYRNLKSYSQGSLMSHLNLFNTRDEWSVSKVQALEANNRAIGYRRFDVKNKKLLYMLQ